MTKEEIKPLGNIPNLSRMLSSDTFNVAAGLKNGVFEGNGVMDHTGYMLEIEKTNNESCNVEIIGQIVPKLYFDTGAYPCSYVDANHVVFYTPHRLSFTLLVVSSLNSATINFIDSFTGSFSLRGQQNFVPLIDDL